jgi:hypothetical protein
MFTGRGFTVYGKRSHGNHCRRGIPEHLATSDFNATRQLFVDANLAPFALRKRLTACHSSIVHLLLATRGQTLAVSITWPVLLVGQGGVGEWRDSRRLRPLVSFM